MAGTVIVPWYATGFRADDFEEALNEVAATALRYGASSYAVYRSKDDRYRFQQFAHFAEHIDWERYWDGPEMTDFRVRYSSWYQIPVLYGWWDRTAAGSIEGETGGARRSQRPPGTVRKRPFGRCAQRAAERRTRCLITSELDAPSDDSVGASDGRCAIARWVACAGRYATRRCGRAGCSRSLRSCRADPRVVVLVHDHSEGTSAPTKSEREAEVEANREGNVVIEEDQAPHTASAERGRGAPTRHWNVRSQPTRAAASRPGNLSGPFQSVRCESKGAAARQPIGHFAALSTLQASPTPTWRYSTSAHDNSHGARWTHRRPAARQKSPSARAAEPEIAISALLQGRHRQPGALQQLPVVLSRLLVAAEDDRLAGVVDDVGDLVAALDAHAGDEACERAGDVLEGVVVVVAHDHPPGVSAPASGQACAWQLDRLAHRPQDKACRSPHTIALMSSDPPRACPSATVPG